MATLTLDQTLNGVVKTRWPTYLGIGKDATDAELQWIARDNSGTVLSVPLGIGLAALQGKLLEMVMLCETGSDVAEARLINYDDDIEYTAQLAGASLPAADVRMVPVCYIGTGAVATSVEMDFIYQGLDIFMPNAS